MLVYLAPLLAICPLYILLRNKKNGEHIILGIVSGYVFILLALRSINSGVDLDAYQNIFNFVSSLSFKELLSGFSLVHSIPGSSVEWGYSVVNWLFAKTGLGFRIFLIFQSLFCVGTACYFIGKNSVRPALSIALLIGFGFVDYTFCIVRQAMSLAFLMFAVDFLERKQIIPTLIFALLAIMMHRTAAIFLAAIPLSFIPVNRKTVLVYCLASLLIIPVFPIVYNKIVEPLFQVFNRTLYITEYGFELKEMLVAVFTIAIFLIFFADSDTIQSGKNSAIFWTFMLTLPLEAISVYTPILSRVTTLTILPFASVLIPNYVETNKNKKLVFTIEILIYVGVIGYYVLCLRYDKRMLNIIPYRFFFLG